MDNHDIQRLMQDAGYYNGGIDGIIGTKQKRGINILINKHSRLLTGDSNGWSWERRAVATAQIILHFAGHEPGSVDGLVGHNTQNAYDAWEGKEFPERDDVIQDESEFEPNLVNGWPHQSEMTKFFGTPGGPQCTAGKVNLPFPMRIAWDKSDTINRFSCHELVASSAERAYRKIHSAYSLEDIRRHGFDLFGGCYNYRNMRGGRSLSTHAYGIAIDTNPESNQLRWNNTRATLARRDCLEFWRIWESEGWISLGRQRNFDWMHVQAARL